MTAPSGIEMSNVVDGVRPQDDLFEHVNGKWIAGYEIPADRATDGAFRHLYDEAEAQVREIITEAADSNAQPGTVAQKIGTLFASFMDEERIEAAGTDPIRAEVDAILAAKNRDELAELMGRLSRSGVGGVLATYVDTDDKDSSRYIVHLSQSGIGLPDEAYYREEQYQDIRDAYLGHIDAMFDLTGIHVSPKAVLEIETAIAAGHWDVVKRRDAELSYNKTRFEDLPQGLAWDRWIAGMGATREQFAEVIVRQPSFIDTVAHLWATRSLDQWKAWTLWRLVRARASYLSRGIVEADFAFYGRTLSGTEALRDRWKRGVSVVEMLLGEAVGQVYVEKHFSPRAKERMQQLVANLLEAYRRSITDLDWMGPQTRQRALEKLEKFTPKIGYPDTWRDYSGLEFTADDVVENVRRGYAFEHDRELHKLGGPVDRGEWFMTPQTVNAYYNPGMNEIVFPAAILQPPFFDEFADDAANYGGIGAVIGHEIGHGFDDQGSKYDGDGNLEDWWTDADREEFGKRTAALIAQYDAFVPQGLSADHHVNGAFTVGENIGDLGGLAIAVYAYQLATDGKDDVVIDGLTGLQRVFYGWAQVWRTKSREAEAIHRLAIDPHSPPEFRCNGVVRNLDSFHDVFSVQPGDALYLDPADRVRIWR